MRNTIATLHFLFSSFAWSHEFQLNTNVDTVQLSPDEKWVVATTGDGHLKIADVGTGNLIVEKQFPGYWMAGTVVRFSPHLDFVTVTLGNDRGAYQTHLLDTQSWNEGSGYECEDGFRRTALEFSPDQKFVGVLCYLGHPATALRVRIFRVSDRVTVFEESRTGAYFSSFTKRIFPELGSRFALFSFSKGRFDHELGVVDLSQSTPTLRSIVPDADLPFGAFLSAAGDRVLVPGVKSKGDPIFIQAWDSAQAKPLTTLDYPPGAPVFPDFDPHILQNVQFTGTRSERLRVTYGTGIWKFGYDKGYVTVTYDLDQLTTESFLRTDMRVTPRPTFGNFIWWNHLSWWDDLLITRNDAGLQRVSDGVTGAELQTFSVWDGRDMFGYFSDYSKGQRFVMTGSYYPKQSYEATIIDLQTLTIAQKISRDFPIHNAVLSRDGSVRVLVSSNRVIW